MSWSTGINYGIVGYEMLERYMVSGVEVTAESGDFFVTSTWYATETGVFYLTDYHIAELHADLRKSWLLSTTLIRPLAVGAVGNCQLIEMTPAYDFVQGSVNSDQTFVENVEITVTDGLNLAYSVSDANGQFSISGRQSDRDYVITFEHPEYLTQALQITAGRRISDFCDIATCVFRVTGSIKDGSGTALQGIDVLAVSGDSGATVSTDKGSFLLWAIDHEVMDGEI